MRQPVAFLSYVRSDDEHDSGKITELRKRIEGEVRIQTGEKFDIFQDRNDLLWGQNWKERIEENLLEVTYLMPIITPSFFKSEMCKKEFEIFLTRERALGENQLILPIYYISAKELESGGNIRGDIVAETIKARNWADWRYLRLEDVSSIETRKAIAKIATDIAAISGHLTAVLDKAKAPSPSVPAAPQVAAAPDTAQKKIVRRRAGGHLESISVPEIGRELQPYSVYTKKFDEVIRPTKLAEAADVMSLQDFLSQRVRVSRRENKKKIEELKYQAKFFGAQELIILVDNSGSLRGAPIEKVSVWLSIISEILDETDVRFEVLGFTTRAWKGGQSRELWLKNGKPANPGRLNDVRYLVYKRFADSYMEALPNFGMMMREGVLKENIDGEAIEWASARFSQSQLKRKLLVVSDGAPVDDSTLTVNHGEILHQNLIDNINKIDKEGKVVIYGAGIDYDVTRYYKRMSFKLSLDRFGSEMIEIMGKILVE